MPGLFGAVARNGELAQGTASRMLDQLTYGRATVQECYQDAWVAMGAAHLGTGGQRALYESADAAVLFFGYLTEPAIPPGAGLLASNAAARLVHDLYLAEGEKTMMGRLAGAFAYAVWDKRTRLLLIATDHLGLRSIYYGEHSGLFRFASEVKGILSDASFPHQPDLAGLSDFFHYSYVLGDKTFFEHIKRLPAASVLRYHEGSWTISRYWDITFPERYPSHPNRWYDELIFTALQGAVQRMASPNVTYALSLSGGMDSRWIAAFLSKVQPNSRSFTLGMPGSDDTEPALKVAEVTGLTSCYQDISPAFVADLGETYTYIADGMYNLFCTEEFPLTVQLGNHADVSVGGFLGDCLFGHEINPVSSVLRRAETRRYWLWRAQGEWLPAETASQVFGAAKSQELEAAALTSLDESIAAAPSERGYQILQYMNLRNRQPRFINVAQQAKLPYVDIYHPLADQSVVQAALLLPPAQLITERAYRRAMARYFPGLAAIPWTFTLTPPTISVPGVILKKAAQLTLGRWLRRTALRDHPLLRPRRYYVDYDAWTRGVLRPFIEKVLLSEELEALGLFDPAGMRTVIQEHMQGQRNATSFIGQALAIALWARLFHAPSTPVRPAGLLAGSHA